MNSFSLQWPEGTDLDDQVLIPLYDITAMTGVESFSDLESQQIGVTVGGSYAFSPALYVTAQAGLDKYIDDEAYVYGDQDGTLYSVSAGVGYRF